MVMGKLTITDECMAPDKYLKMKYSGPDPWAMAKKIGSTIRPFFHVSSSGTNNIDLRWDVVGENISFYSQWWYSVYVSQNF